MPVLSAIARRLRLPDAPEGMDRLGRYDRMRLHQEILAKKPYFKELISDLHQDLLSLVDQYSATNRGQLIEIGSGVIPLRDQDPRVISTDVEYSADLSCIADAMAMPYPAKSTSAIVGQNVLHHIPDPNIAFSEFDRILMNGGVVVLVEPYYGWFSSIVYPTLFTSEGYDKSVGATEAVFNREGLPIPNQAMSFKYFEGGSLVRMPSCPSLSIVHHAPLESGLRYLLSGALNFRRVAPRWSLGALRVLERRKTASRFLRFFAIHWVIVLQKEVVACGN